MTHPFHPFTAEHFIAVGIGVMAMVVLLVAGKRGGTGQRWATAVLAFCNLSVYPLSTAAWRAIDGPVSIDNLLPLHLCDLAAIVAGFALFTRRPLLCAVTYFWGLAATAQALITPAISVGFPAPPFIMFFVQHFAVVIAALYLPLVLGWRPKSPWWRSPLEVFGVSMAYLLAALGVNHMLGSNFAFVTRPPDNPSLIDHLGPWPWYIFCLAGIAFCLFLLLALPFATRRKA